MKRNKLLLIAAILGTAYLIYLISYFTGINTTSTDSTEAAGSLIATALVTPHMVLVAVAVVFNWLGFALNAKWGALVAGILYAVSMALFIMYFMFVIVEMILCFVAYSKMKKASVVTPEVSENK